MSGFDNEVVYANNVDFSGGSPVSAKLISDGQMLIASTALNAGGTNVNVGRIISPDASVTIGYSSPNITLQASSLTPIGVQSYVNSSVTLQTGDATQATVVWSANTWEVGGSNMNTGTGVYTIPIGGAGKYLVNYALTFSNLTAAHNSSQFRIFTNVGAITKKVLNPGVSLGTNSVFQINDTIILNLTAGQTIFVNGFVSGSTKTVGFLGVEGGLQNSYISIFRISS